VTTAARLLFAPRELPPLAPDAAADVDRYRVWVRDRELERLARPTALGRRPGLVAVVLVVDDPDPVPFAATLRSVAAQTYPRWRLVLVTGSPLPDDAAVREAMAAVGPRRCVLVEARGPNAEADATDLGVRATRSPYVLLLGQHDGLAPDALALLVQRLAGGGTAYADEDRIDVAGRLSQPALKPDWSPELLLHTPYVGRPLLVRRRALEQAGGVRPLPGGDWEHDLLLRLGEAGPMTHVAEVLYHRRVEPAVGRSVRAGPRAVTEALNRRRERADVDYGPLPGTWRLRRTLASAPSVSVVIPFREGTGYLRACVDSLLATSAGVDLDVVLVDNGSVEPETASLVERLTEHPAVTVTVDPRPFNWAALNNAAVARARGDLLLFLNNDIEALRAGWLEALAAQALRPEVGVVGARLLYPDGRVQHAGVVLGLGGAAGHVLAGLPGDRPGYLGMAVLTRDVSAVTGACLMTRRDVFSELGGFDEALGLDLNDVDYCLRAREADYGVIYEPGAELLHYESPSRGTSGSVENIRRFVDRWESAITAGDPSLNSRLTRVESSCALQVSDEEGWWQRWRSTLGSC